MRDNVAVGGQAAESLLTVSYRYSISMSAWMKTGTSFPPRELMNGESWTIGTFMVCVIFMGFRAETNVEVKISQS